VYLKLPIFRYVDDFFGPLRREDMEHGLQCFARLVRLLLGGEALAEDKLECGHSLVILGVRVELSSKGYKCMPASEKVSSLFCK